MSKQITPWSSDDIRIGDLITITRYDTRKWKRFIHWVLRLDPPMVKQTLTVSMATKTVLKAAAMQDGRGE